MLYRVVLPRIAREGNRGTGPSGYARPSYARLCVRTHEFFREISGELGEWWLRTLWDCALTSVPTEWRRIEREHMEEAALGIHEAIRRLPRSVRDVVEMRAVGLSWTEVSRRLPGRAYFSLTDDWASAVRMVRERCGDLVARMT